MADTAWDVFLYQTIKAIPAVLTIVDGEDNIYGQGSLEGSPASKPFVLLRSDGEVPAAILGHSIWTWSVYVHDDPGDLGKVQDALAAIRAVLTPDVGRMGQHPGGLVKWLGNSFTASDETYRTVYQYSTYQCIGRDGAD